MVLSVQAANELHNDEATKQTANTSTGASVNSTTNTRKDYAEEYSSTTGEVSPRIKSSKCGELQDTPVATANSEETPLTTILGATNASQDTSDGTSTSSDKYAPHPDRPFSVSRVTERVDNSAHRMPI